VWYVEVDIGTNNGGNFRLWVCVQASDPGACFRCRAVKGGVRLGGGSWFSEKQERRSLSTVVKQMEWERGKRDSEHDCYLIDEYGVFRPQRAMYGTDQKGQGQDGEQ